jgi:diguanylate cyclase (GGDEF)-like protein
VKVTVKRTNGIKEKRPIRKKQRPIIGLIIEGTDDAFQGVIWSAIVKAADEQGINLLCFSLGMDEGYHAIDYYKTSIMNLITSEKISGFIILTAVFLSHGEDKNLEFINFVRTLRHVPCVSIGAEIEGTSSLMVDNKNGMAELLIHLIRDHGYRKIGFIKGPASNPEAMQRFEVYERILKKFDIPYDKNRVFEGDFLFDVFMTKEVETAFAAILEHTASMDAIVAANDNMAINLMNRMKEYGIAVPGDVAVAGFDDIEQSRNNLPQLTTVHQPLRELGIKAFDILLSGIRGRKMPVKTILSTRLVVRRSCGCFSYLAMNAIGQGKQAYPALSGRKRISKQYIIENIRKNLEEEIPMGPDRAKIKSWAGSLVDALLENSKKRESKYFFLTLEKIIWEGIDFHIDVLRWNAVMYLLLEQAKSLLVTEETAAWIDGIWKEALIIISTIAVSHDRKMRSDAALNFFLYYFLTNTLISIMDTDELKKIIIDLFPQIGIPSCYIALVKEGSQETSALIVGYDRESGYLLEKGSIEFPSLDLAPAEAGIFDFRKSFFVKSLYYKDVFLGHILLQIGPLQGELYENYATQISSTVRSIQLMEKIRAHSQELEIIIKERTRELVEANRQLKNLDSLKNDFIANITHDFRSPLTIILNTAELALRSDKKINDQGNYKLIFDSSLKLRTSIDRLLDLARMDTQGIKLNLRKINITSFINNLVQFYISSVINSGIKIHLSLPTHDIAEFYLDIEKLEEVLNNIISNAVKFIDAQTGMIRVCLQDSPDCILIAISDNGIGIPRNKLHNIFGRFEQARQGRDTGLGGTGIGLAFSKELVKYMNGKIWAESEGEGKGAEFFVQLPKVMSAGEKSKITPEDVNVIHNRKIKEIIRMDLAQKTSKNETLVFIDDLNGEEEFDHRKGIILIIDDNMEVCKIIMDYLSMNGYKNFIVSNSAKTGLDAAYEHSPQLIISDYNMPGMKGDELHDRLAANPRFKRIPFIFLSAVADKKLITERREKGAAAYLKKPIDEKDLLLTVELHMKNYFEYLMTLQLAMADELTGINNRRAILKRLNDELSFRTYRDLSLVFMDVDFFKEYNDTHGHQAGDAVLKRIGKLLKTRLREYDVPGRFGGDEFIILLPDTNIHQARAVAESLKYRLKNDTLQRDQNDITVTLSFGLVSLKDHASYIEKKLDLACVSEMFEGRDVATTDWEKMKEKKHQLAELLLYMADMALYRAKTTYCTQCNFSSVGKEVFKDIKCPQCGSVDMVRGRDNIMAFDGSESRKS